MSVSRSATRVPMKKLLAVVTLVGTASGAAIAVRSSPSAASAAAIAVAVPNAPVDRETPQRTDRSTDHVIDPPTKHVMDRLTDPMMRPLALRNGWPACGNLVDKAGFTHRRPCPTTQEQTVTVVVDSVLLGAR
jgi:hypothetical protein